MTWIVKDKSTAGNEVDVYELEEQDFDEKYVLRGDYNDILLVCYRGPDKLWVQFAVFEFCSSTHEGQNQYTILFHGEGPSGNLRECRHIWWGENGYTFMLDFELVEKAFAVLRRWFD